MEPSSKPQNRALRINTHSRRVHLALLCRKQTSVEETFQHKLQSADCSQMTKEALAYFFLFSFFYFFITFALFRATLFIA